MEMVPVRSRSLRRRLVIRNPEMMKKQRTPKLPVWSKWDIKAGHSRKELNDRR